MRFIQAIAFNPRPYSEKLIPKWEAIIPVWQQDIAKQAEEIAEANFKNKSWFNKDEIKINLEEFSKRMEIYTTEDGCKPATH
jgi:hypothetical protein